MPKVRWVILYCFVANFIRFPVVQKFWKSVKIWQSYREFQGGPFFETQCTLSGHCNIAAVYCVSFYFYFLGSGVCDEIVLDGGRRWRQSRSCWTTWQTFRGPVQPEAVVELASQGCGGRKDRQSRVWCFILRIVFRQYRRMLADSAKAHALYYRRSQGAVAPPGRHKNV